MFDYNVNPWLINYGMLIRGYSPNSDNLLLKWYHPPIQQLGVLIQGWHYPWYPVVMIWFNGSHGPSPAAVGELLWNPELHRATWTRHLRRFAVLLHLIMHRLSTGFNMFQPSFRWCRISQPSTVSFLTKVLETDDLWQTHGHKQPAFADLDPHVAGVFLVYTAVGNWLVRWLYHWKHCIWPHGDTLHSFSQKTTRSKRSPLSFYSRFILIGWEPGFVKMDYEQ